jgi:hypothetical protein
VCSGIVAQKKERKKNITKHIYGTVQKYPQNNIEENGCLDKMIVFSVSIVVMILFCDFLVTL